ncbi:MAG: hypothetical protein P9M07_02825 [Candidatus Aceula meridiana]|nr:hypothetical protein [Candidatus Aceula meridiana]
MKDKEFINKFSTDCGKDVSFFFSPHKLVIIYTSLKIILKMKKHLGLEAMLEYLSRYALVIEKQNPQLKEVVDCAVSRVNVSKIYQEAMKTDDI